MALCKSRMADKTSGWSFFYIMREALLLCAPPPVKLPQIAICVDISSDSALFWLNFNQCCTIGLGGHTFPSDTDALLIIISVLLNSTWNSLSRDMIQLPTLASTQRVFSITSLPCSHVGPAHPGVQEQLNPPTISPQVAPFIQGALAHSSTSKLNKYIASRIRN